jgi:hypothetical protein
VISFYTCLFSSQRQHYQHRKQGGEFILVCSIFHALIRFVKCVNNQQMRLNFMMYFYLFKYVNQHVSVCNPAIFRVKIQEQSSS